MRPIIFALTLSFVPLALPMVSAQEIPPQTAEMRPEAIARGEIGLEGRIKSISGPGAFDIEASSFTTEDGRTIEFEQAKPKSIQAIENVFIAWSGNTRARLTMQDVKLGFRVQLIGRNVNGKPFQARFIALNGEVLSNSEKMRGVPTSAPVGIAITEGANVFDAGDFSLALTIFKQAQGLAVGSGDNPGLASALVWLASSYVKLNQWEKAEEAFKQAITVATNGSPKSLPNALVNYAGLLRRIKRVPEAITLLERARALSDEQTEKVQVIIVDNLANAYYADRQWDKAATLWSSIVARIRVQSGVAGEIRTLLDVAAAQFKADNPDESTRNLAVVQKLFNTIDDPMQRANAHVAFGTYYIRIRDKTNARQHLEQALADFEALHDAYSVARVRASLETFDEPAVSAETGK